MLNITYTHSSNSGSSAKSFRFTDAEEITVDVKVPNQARQIITFAHELSQDKDTFTYSDLETYIDSKVPNFTTSKGGTMRIIRYYSKLLQTTGILIPA